MNCRTHAFAVVAAMLVVAASVGVALAAQSASATDAGVAATGTAVGVVLQSPLADLIDLIQRLDAFLETVLDLLRTISQLFGAGETGE